MYQPGWYPDPYGRFARRYHDGRAWTEHVADLQSTQSRDPVPVAGATGTSLGGPAAGTAGTGFGAETTGGTPAGGWAQPTSAGWQPPAGSRPPTTGFGPPGEQRWTAPGSTTTTATTTTWPTTTAAPAEPAARRGVAAWLGPVLAIAGAVLVIIGLFSLKWLDEWNRSEVGTYIKTIVDERNANPNVLSETWFRWGWIVGLIAGAIALLAALSANRTARIVGAVLALVAALWALFGWLNFHAYLNNDSNNRALDLNRNISLREGGWLTVLGFLLLAVGALLGGPLGRRRPRVS